MSEAKPTATVGGYKIAINASGEFDRKPSAFRNWIKADGSTPFQPERDRYHLYVSLACPWAHRTLIVRHLKGLEGVLPCTVVDWFLGAEGWTFTDKKPKCTLDVVNGCSRLMELYLKTDPEYTGRSTVPVLWDKKTKQIVNNESSEIIRMLNCEFNEFCATEEQKKLDLYPAELRHQIDEINEWVYPGLNNGVYRSGFAHTQEAYDKAVRDVFQTLIDWRKSLARADTSVVTDLQRPMCEPL
jgi:putative glutathione S-transferase